MAQPPFYPQAGGPVSQPVYFAPPQSPEHPADSVGSWMLALFLTGIPIVGFIYVLVVAFGGSASPSRCNWRGRCSCGRSSPSSSSSSSSPWAGGPCSSLKARTESSCLGALPDPAGLHRHRDWSAARVRA